MDGRELEREMTTALSVVAEYIRSAVEPLSKLDLSCLRQLADYSHSRSEANTDRNLAHFERVQQPPVTLRGPSRGGGTKNRGGRLPRLWPVIDEHLARIGKRVPAFAGDAGVDPKTIRRIRDGVGRPTEETVRGVAKAIGITPAELRRRAS
jgi:hypothetical protein